MRTNIFNKTTVFLLICSIFFLSSCFKQEGPKNVKVKKEVEKSEENNIADKQESNCFDLCNSKIPSLCGSNNSIQNCEANCGYWRDSLKECINNAKSCDQFSLDLNYSANDLSLLSKSSDYLSKLDELDSKNICNPNVEKEEKTEEKVLDKSCNSACNKYKKCASYGEDATSEDIASAYDSCYIECQKWSDETLNCSSKVQIDSPADCSPLTMCTLKEYSDILNN